MAANAAGPTKKRPCLIAYLVDFGELDWYQIREGTVSGETHYKAILKVFSG